MKWAILAVITGALLGGACGSAGSTGNPQDGVHEDQRAADSAGEVRQDHIGSEDVAPDLDAIETDAGDQLAQDLEPADLRTDDITDFVSLDAQEVAALTDAEKEVLKKLFPEAASFLVKLFDLRRYFVAWDGVGPVGHAFSGSAYGFNSEVVSVTGFDSAGVTVGLEVLSQWESWWFQVEYDQAFFAQFKGLDTALLNPATRDSGPYKIDAVSGATFSSRAVIDGFWMAVEGYKALEGR